MKPRLTYTKTDEAPALATRSLLPIIRAFLDTAGIEVELKDISLAGRILAGFPEYLPPEKQVPDALAELGTMVQRPETNIIKLPNISASIPQLKAAIAELQQKGYPVPDFPETPQSDTEKAIFSVYNRIKGSAVNPVLREGNSDRRAAEAVKQYAMKHPHSMGAWSTESQSRVASMREGDFYGSEQSATLDDAATVRIELTDTDGRVTVLKDTLSLQKGEIIDAAVMSRDKLRAFYTETIRETRENGNLFSLHLKATMMKVSDPVIFGHAVAVFFAPVFEKYAAEFAALGVNPDNGLGDLYGRLKTLPDEKREAIESALRKCLENGPDLAMVDSDRGITNLHVPSDVIIDASMPAAIRTSGKMWGSDGKLHDMTAAIPDRCYAGVYQAAIDFCRKNGAFDPSTMGSVSNVGLMAQKAEEYGSHDKTFVLPANGIVRIRTTDGKILTEHQVAQGDIFRACQAKDAPIRDWIGLAVKRARLGGTPAVFWLDPERAHDRALIAKVENYLPEHDTEGLEIYLMSPTEATTYSLERAKAGKDTISVTGNVLRDYLTDLFPILELGTSAKMLSIVPLMNGGGLFETGAGGSAPRHVQQFLSEGHLRWDSLGEFLALAVSLEHLAERTENAGARVLAAALNRANTIFLEENRSPSRKVNEPDNRSSHYYLARYWAEALAEQTEDTVLASRFASVAAALKANEEAINRELLAAQGGPVDIGGYYFPDEMPADAAMRPSATLNAIIAAI